MATERKRTFKTFFFTTVFILIYLGGGLVGLNILSNAGGGDNEDEIKDLTEKLMSIDGSLSTSSYDTQRATILRNQIEVLRSENDSQIVGKLSEHLDLLRMFAATAIIVFALTRLCIDKLRGESLWSVLVWFFAVAAGAVLLKDSWIILAFMGLIFLVLLFVEDDRKGGQNQDIVVEYKTAQPEAGETLAPHPATAHPAQAPTGQPPTGQPPTQSGPPPVPGA